jgi:hypothetical protein
MLGCVLASPAAEDGPQKKFIEIGWDMPDTDKVLSQDSDAFTLFVTTQQTYWFLLE